MTADACDCGHYDYDHVNMQDACDVAYCECKSFVSMDNDNNPWGEGEDAE